MEGDLATLKKKHSQEMAAKDKQMLECNDSYTKLKAEVDRLPDPQLLADLREEVRVGEEQLREARKTKEELRGQLHLREEELSKMVHQIQKKEEAE
jgi:hypothetical protein